jgi:adenosylcobinamide-GDP ribazoletransferase
MSLGMFSSIPCPYRPWNEKARHLMLVFLPMVGLVTGFIWYGLYLLADRTNIPVQLQTAVLMLYPYLITGFIHLDGFMDTSDAILSRRSLEEKLRILKDPHTGAFSVISVAVLFIICYGSMSATLEQVYFKQSLDIAEGDPMLALILIPVITRCCSAVAVMAGKPLAHSQYREATDAGKPAAAVTAVCLIGLAAIAVSLLIGTGFYGMESTWSVPVVLAGAVLAYLAALISAVRQLKGVSGDIAGYSLTIAEAFALVMLALLT